MSVSPPAGGGTRTSTESFQPLYGRADVLGAAVGA
jgi:hypothetical protein